MKSAIDVRVTNLSELLLNQIRKSAVVERATEIVNRESNNQDKAKDNRESENQELNYHVSEFCQIRLGCPEDGRNFIWKAEE